eukprot:TRINITY_DN74225_c0_g1_i1.p1 TRINITY_DN74225_c0_g1~~TRINITY_DN74225_c0_g1_i1.p1  ORF type:complete len:404 (+),score=62.05 TRINITY_DN74225_c0_g1_i1:213-1424(+)
MASSPEAKSPFPPRIPNYITCGLGVDRKMVVSVSEVALLVDVMDLPEDLGPSSSSSNAQQVALAAQLLVNAKRPLVLAFRPAKDTTVRALTERLVGWLSNRGGVKPAATQVLVDAAASDEKIAGPLSHVETFVVMTSLRLGRVALSRGIGESVVFIDRDLAVGVGNTFLGPNPAVPTVIADMDARHWSIVAEGKRRRSEAENFLSPKSCRSSGRRARKGSYEGDEGVCSPNSLVCRAESLPDSDTSFVSADDWVEVTDMCLEDEIDIEATDMDFVDAVGLPAEAHTPMTSRPNLAEDGGGGGDGEGANAATAKESLSSSPVAQEVCVGRFPRWCYIGTYAQMICHVAWRRRRPLTLFAAIGALAAVIGCLKPAHRRYLKARIRELASRLELVRVDALKFLTLA